MRYAAERPNLDESIQELCQLADGGNDILAEAAGITCGAWYAWPSTHIGHELIAAGMLIMAGGGNGTPLDYDEVSNLTPHLDPPALVHHTCAVAQRADVWRPAGGLPVSGVLADCFRLVVDRQRHLLELVSVLFAVV